VTLNGEKGESIASMGKSGEGKSTLLNLFGTLDTPTSGTLKVCGIPVCGTQKSSLRNAQIGFIFQFYNLLDDFSALENVLMPARIARQNSKKIKEQAHYLLNEVGLSHKVHEPAKVLSGGEKQRVAIARALLNTPALVLADEPTGNLDRSHSIEIQDLLLGSAREQGTTLIVVTHDSDFAARCSRLLHLKEGHLYTPDS
jgi:lipoprotein-releasing system ATP-binding protein